MSINGRGRPSLPPLAIGTQFLHLRVLALAEPVLVNGYLHPRYLLVCGCGTEIVRTRSQIHKKPDARCRSCASAVKGDGTGRLWQTYRREYASWRAMRERCTNPRHFAYGSYGGRGIKVCRRWEKFESFLADMGPRPDGTSLERVKNDKGYTPANCVWATPTQQNSNTRANVYLTAQGVRQTQAAWARALGTAPTVIMSRLRRGWSEEDACTLPVAGLHRKNKRKDIK